MSLYEDYENGGKAYYDEVPRYKNPYSGNNHYDDSNHAAWEKGWKRASQEHNLFTENQLLKAKNEELEREHAECMEENMFLVDDKSRFETEVGALKGDNEYLREVAIRCKEDKETFVMAFDIAGNKIDVLHDSTVEISTLLREVFYYSTDSNIFSFRREKLIQFIKDLRVKVLAMEKLFPEKIIKTKKKP